MIFFQWITTPLSLKITNHLLRILPVRQEEDEEYKSSAPKLVMDTPERLVDLAAQTETLPAQIETLEQERNLYQRERNRYQLRYIEEQQKCFHLERELIERACHDHDYLELKMDYSTGTHVMEK